MSSVTELPTAASQPVPRQRRRGPQGGKNVVSFALASQRRDSQHWCEQNAPEHRMPPPEEIRRMAETVGTSQAFTRGAIAGRHITLGYLEPVEQLAEQLLELVRQLRKEA